MSDTSRAVETDGSVDRLGHAAIAVAVVSIATAAILVREADTAGVTVAFWRNLIGGLVLVPFGVRSWRAADDATRSSWAGEWKVLVAAGVALGAHFAFWLEGLLRTTVAASVTLVTLSPIFVALGTVLVLRERLSAMTWPGVAIAMVGAVIVGWVGVEATDVATDPTTGNLLSFLGAVMIAVYILIGRRLRSAGLPTVVYASFVYLVAAVVVLPVVVIREGTPFTLDAQGWVLIAVMVIGPQLLGHTMINFALDRIAPTTVSVATLMEPIGSALLAWWLLSEAPTSGVWIGAPIAIVGLVIVVLAGRDD